MKFDILQSDFWKNIQSFWKFLKQLLTAHWSDLLMLLIGVYLPLQLFGILAVKVWENPSVFSWDERILLAIHAKAQPQLDILAVILTKLGSVKIVFPFLSVISLVLLPKKQWRSLTYLVFTTGGSTIINLTVKELMHRVRPHLWESSIHKLDYAFPSGHAMTSMTLAAVFLILTWSTRWRWLILIFGSLYVLTIAWTRLYLGVHFPSDILAGWMVSVAWAMGVSLILKPKFTASAVNEEI